MDLMPIANKLEFEGLGVQGKTLFINFMPMEAKTAIMLRTPLSGVEIDHELPGYFKTHFIVVARAPEYVAALDLMKSVMTALTLYDEDVDTINVKYMRPATLPVSFPVSDGNFYEVQVRFDTAFTGGHYGYDA
jgi:hypothetical protein